MDKKSTRGIEIIQIVGESAEEEDKLNWFVTSANDGNDDETKISPTINFPVEQLEIVKINEK